MPRAGERARRRVVAGFAVAAVAAILGALGAAGTPDAAASAAPAQALAPVSARATADTSGPSIALYASDAGVLDAGADLTVSVVITAADSDVPAGQVELSIAGSPFHTRSQLNGWLATSAPTGVRPLATAPTTAVLAGLSMVAATITVPKAKLGLSGETTAVYGIAATVTTLSETIGTATGVIVRHAALTPHLSVAVAMPITVPGRADGLISAADLTTYTAPDGILTRELEAVTGNPQLTLAIDPMIVASIRVLGSAAPASAQQWYASLAALGNDSFALQYGDADVAAELQAGATQLLRPISFDYALDPAAHQTPLTVGEPPEGDEGPTPQPTATTPPSTLPTLQQLLHWPHALHNIAWPAPGSMGSADVAALAKLGVSTTILSASNSNAARISGTVDAPLSVTGGTALVADAGVSAALEAAYSAQTPAASGVAMAQLNAQLALAAAQAQPGAVILATLDRSAPSSSAFAADAVHAVFASPFTTAASFADALTAPPTSGLALVSKSESSTRVDTVEALFDRVGVRRAHLPLREPNLSTFSTVLADPALLRGPARNQLLTVLSVAWTRPNAARPADAAPPPADDTPTPSPDATPGAPVPPQNWGDAVSDTFTSLDTQLNAIQISSPGHVLQLSNQANIPIPVTNQLPYPVQIQLRAVPSSPRLEIDSATDKTIPAGSTVKVLIPVKSQVSNGTATLLMQLYSDTGVAVGASATASVQVHADWEGIGAAIFGVIVVGFFGFGVVRSIRRRRRERDADDTDASADAGGAAEPPPAVDATDPADPAATAPALPAEDPPARGDDADG